MSRYVETFFTIKDEIAESIQSWKPVFGFDGFGEAIFYRTYSRNNNGKQETWNDVVLRVTNGVYSIRKDHYTKNHIEWKEDFWQNHAARFAMTMFMMRWIPPGRGLWAMGTPFIWERGSMALYNCAFTNLTSDNLADDLEWMMDSLMLGVGVGFKAIRDEMNVFVPQGTPYKHIIPDTREGWAESLRLLVQAYTAPNTRKPEFIYNEIRPEGLPIKGFGGLSSGPRPLMELHKKVEEYFLRYHQGLKNYDILRLKTDLANHIGICVVAGNVRRSAELAMGNINDEVFLDLKDYDKYPERRAVGYMSNNTAECETDYDFQQLHKITSRIVVRGEPGAANKQNFKLGRVGKKNRGLKPDAATGLNPCGEIPLEHRETCNVVETCPTRCNHVEEWYEACHFAAFYASTVSLLPTHQSSTNRVVARNRRIGVSIVDGAYWMEVEGLHKVTSYLREGYKVVRRTNKHVNAEAGVPEAIRVTTIKPGGTVPKLVGGIGGIGYATFNATLRRVRVAHNNPIVPILRDAGLGEERCIFDGNTLIFKFPTYQHGRPATEVSIWEQAANLVTFQREWADNSVSNTLYFKPKWKLYSVLKPVLKTEEAFREVISGCLDWKVNELKSEDDDGQHRYKLEYDDNGNPYQINFYIYDPNHEENVLPLVLAHIMPMIKACSFLPHSDVGVYPQMPEEGISEDDYTEMKSNLKPFDWSSFTGDGEDERYCNNGICEVPIKKD